jgi:integrase
MSTLWTMRRPNDRMYPIPKQYAKRLFEKMLFAYCSRLMASNMSLDFIDGSRDILLSISRELGFPWDWSQPAWEGYMAARRAAGKALTTRRKEQLVVDTFTKFVAEPETGFPQFLAEYGLQPAHPIVSENRILHKETEEANRKVRAFTFAEVQILFAYLKARIDRYARSGKGAVTTYRDCILIMSAYAWGARRAELAELCWFDFCPNATLPEFGEYGAVVIRNGKAKRGGPPRRRTVATSPLVGWIVPEMQHYREHVWPLFTRNVDKHLFVTEGGRPLELNAISAAFARYVAEAGLDRALTLHSLRRSFATHHVQADYASAFVSNQMGHEDEHSTSIYIDLGDDYLRQQLLFASDSFA